MNGTRFVFCYVALAGLSLLSPRTASSHPGHDAQVHDHRSVASTTTLQLAQAQPDAAQTKPAGVSGQGEFKFRVRYTSDLLPVTPEALLKAHGGFAVDRREGKGEVYFALPGAGIIQISPDLAKAEVLPTDAAMKDTNLHNAGIWQTADGTPYLIFPGNDAGKVFTTTLSGELVHTLEAPAQVAFADPTVVAYFQDGGKFVPTDVAELGSLYYITTGYSNLDYVLTAEVAPGSPFNATWNPLAFAGRGTGPGQLGTGHGVTIAPDRKRVTVADRPNAEIDRFTPEGAYLDTVKLPEGSFPCDIDYVDEYACVGCLHGPDRNLGAPIYILKGDKLVSTIMPREELGLANFTHVHNAVLVKSTGRYYVVAQAWNPGDFAILEQVTE